MKTKHQSEIKIGLIVVAAFLVFIWGINYLKGLNLLKRNVEYVVPFNRINGLVKSSPVILDGYQVGLVKDINYLYDQPGHIIVTLSLNRKLRLPLGTVATIESALIGNPTITLTLGPSGNPFLEEGDTLVAQLKPSFMETLSQGMMADVQTLIKRTDSVVGTIETLVANGDLEQSLSSLKQTTTNLSRLSDRLDQSLEKEFPSILHQINNMTLQYGELGTKLNQLDLTETKASLDHTLEGLENLTIQLNSTDNSLGLLLHDTTLYLNLNQTVSSANNLLIDLKEHPKRYVHFSLIGPTNKP